MLEACGALLACECAPSLCVAADGDAVARPLLRALVQLMADGDHNDAARVHITRLAALALGLPPAAAAALLADDDAAASAADRAKAAREKQALAMRLFERHFGKLLDSILVLPDPPPPAAGAPPAPPPPPRATGVLTFAYERAAFDVLLRTASAVAGPHLPRVLPVFTAHSKPEVCEDPDTRLAMMALLETTLSDAECAKHLGQFAKVLLVTVVLPNSVWRAGRVACTIRKVCACARWRDARARTEGT